LNLINGFFSIKLKRIDVAALCLIELWSFLNPKKPEKRK